MRILLASSEVHPYSKTGGLADMTGALARELAREGHQVGIVTPLYWGIRERFPQLAPVHLPVDVPLGVERVRGEVWSLEPATGLTVYFVDAPGFFQRSGLYQKDGVDFPDNAERFVFFSKAVSHLSLHLPWKPELVHLNDWQTGLAALLLHHQRKLSDWESAPRTCLTIHNLAYQGLFPAAEYALTNLPWDYFVPEGVEFYGQLNSLKAGIAFADAITTVSPRYAREIITEEFGCGVDGLLRHRQARLFGILNGADYEEWNPQTDPYIDQPFSNGDLAGKQANKFKLQHEFGLPADPSVPLFGNIGRMVAVSKLRVAIAKQSELHAAIDDSGQRLAQKVEPLLPGQPTDDAEQKGIRQDLKPHTPMQGRLVRRTILQGADGKARGNVLIGCRVPNGNIDAVENPDQIG